MGHCWCCTVVDTGKRFVVLAVTVRTERFRKSEMGMHKNTGTVVQKQSSSAMSDEGKILLSH